MSLKHILNDDPPLQPLQPPGQHAPPHANGNGGPMLVVSPKPVTPLSPISQSHSQRDGRSPPDVRNGEPAPAPREYGGYQQPPGVYQGAPHGQWEREHYTNGDRLQAEDVPSGPSSSYHAEQEESATPSPRISNGSRKEESLPAEGNGRVLRKRKLPDDDEDYHPPGQKRQLRRTPRTRQQHRNETPASETVDDTGTEEQVESAEEDSRLGSDLEDCPELWMAELGTYVIETHKRQKQVDAWFSRWIIERDSITAYRMSHHYRDKLARIPPPPPPPPPTMPMMEEDHIAPYLHDGVPYEPSVGPKRKGKGKDVAKRPPPTAASDSDGDVEVPISAMRPPQKRRRLEKEDGGDDQRSIADESVAGASPANKLLKRGKGKQRETSVDSGASATPKVRRKPGPRRKHDNLPPQTQEALGIGSAAPSVAGDVTPAGSRPPSPTLTSISATVYELDEAIPPLKRARKVDDTLMIKRVKNLEETQRKVWMNIARRDVAKVYKYYTTGQQIRRAQTSRLATLSSIQARRPFQKTAKATKDVQTKAKRLMREMLVFWKKNEKEERDVRKREQKEAIDRAKVEEEKREAARQARKLEFLISQTELYSHFVGNKLKTAEIEGEAPAADAPTGANLEDVEGDKLQEIDFDDDDETNIYRHARHNAQAAISAAKKKAQEFDTNAALERKTNEALKLAKRQAHIRADEDVEQPGGNGTPLVDLDSDELNFQNPTGLGELTIAQPKMLMATLKEYQIKGLNWLATLYEQGINGILADEMGLGKTVQSISLLAYLAETHDIWGPFLVVSPASTLHNWQQEITRFVPKLKALPYWGNPKDRATLRKFWSKKEISYDQDAPFHVLITSYQLVIQDQQYFQRVKWQYMILDEAQNIKNSSSARWKTLLGFQCRNRLLLTGTPIQNSMQELWALLHFIMPSLFDSHDEFNEWFSKDIENAAENKGSKLNEHQLRRLHMILKPFMLRRVKKHVQNELSEKIEEDIYVELSARQRNLYKALLANVSVQDLLEKAANFGDAESARSLMNLVMQFRKVCNHPELFERADVVAPYSFSDFGRSGPLNREGDFVQLPYSTRNPIEYTIPTLFLQDGGLLDVPQESSLMRTGNGPLAKMMNIWSTELLYRSIQENDSAFSFLKFIDVPPSDASVFHSLPTIARQVHALHLEKASSENEPYNLDPIFAASAASNPYGLSPLEHLCNLDVGTELPALRDISTNTWAASCLSRADLRWFMPPVVAPPISVYCADRTFVERQAQIVDAPQETLALYGMPQYMWDYEPAHASFGEQVGDVPVSGLLANSPSDQLPLSFMQIPEAKRLIYDSGKLARLDSLLQTLKAGDHRCLIYFQMTRMMDLMEEYLIFRQYKYLRLDGSSKLEDRRDMVMEWQTRPDIFIFILSTRAGGLGINLTAADTVIFYDHDWNPSNDAQAMDRAHRLGQTRQVTVYRLITRGTIDERIVQLARVKKDVQDIVVGNKTFTDVAKPNEIVQLLLNEDQLANLDVNSGGASSKAAGKRPAGAEGASIDLWNEEGDEFFGGQPTDPGRTLYPYIMASYG
ncbi:SNF2 family N-terminal domain-containing protein [Epithele typhae]|uniref:SNF2 family N-terminal domain-containing protein n=1 Tax=Epithele typhae TaxID=378194 RepID=UPI002008610D|nr:SNF2 family N-terminal domain-containing protein [Epithele typhae]KAH9944513.1 SNF2 family N-terminal domain-containing protein [Epithele typhae]